MAKIFLTTPGSGTWTVPADCLEATIECIGGGASGGSIWWGPAESAGGGGGAYAKKNTITLTPGANISYSVGLGGVHPSGSSAHWVSGTDTWFKSTSDVLAKGANHNTGGQASACVGDVKYNGGNGGGNGGSAVNGGGGGAAGPNGVGNNGTNGTGGGGPGGSGDAGFGGAGGSASGVGGAGTEFDSTHGSGGGGGGCSFNANGGNGGAYGAGGGGNYRLDLGAIPGAGENGIIVITYTPVVTGTSQFFQLFN